jgi:hypothetical protein
VSAALAFLLFETVRTKMTVRNEIFENEMQSRVGKPLEKF